MKINREYFKANKENMEGQVRHLLMTTNKEIKVTKVLWDTQNNIGLLQWKSNTIKGLRLVFIENSQVLVKNLQDYLLITEEREEITDTLYRSVRHRGKPSHIVEYRFR